MALNTINHIQCNVFDFNTDQYFSVSESDCVYTDNITVSDQRKNM